MRKILLASVLAAVALAACAASARADDSAPPAAADAAATDASATTPDATVTVNGDGTTVVAGNNAGSQNATVTQSASAVAVAIANVQVVGATCESNCPTIVLTFNSASAIAVNAADIQQTLEQVCLACISSVTIVNNPPAAAATGGDPPAPPQGPGHEGYCAPHPMMRADGSVGVFLDLIAGQPNWDPTYAGATPASVDPATGAIFCNTDAQPDVPTFTITGPPEWQGKTINLCVTADKQSAPVCTTLTINE